MLKHLILTTTVLILMSVASSHEPQLITAQDEKPESKATDRRPINDQMTFDEARAAADRREIEALQAALLNEIGPGRYKAQVPGAGQYL